MKLSILAARRQTAVERIVIETQRLGGSLTIPGGRGDVEHQQLALLEAIAEGLAAIVVPEGSSEPAAAVEAVISVEDKPTEEEVEDKPTEEEVEDKPASRKRGKP